MLKSLSLLLVATPSGAGVAVSTGIKSYISALSKHQIYLRNPGVFEKINKTSHIAFDKTGTLTQGVLLLRQTELYDSAYTEADLIRIAAACEADNYHPIAVTLQESAGADYDVTKVESSVYIPSNGVKAEYDGHRVIIGNLVFMEENGIDISAALEKYQRYESQFYTPVLISIDRILSGMFVLQDILRSGAVEMIGELKGRNLFKITMLTGDKKAKADHWAKRLGIDKVYSEVDERDKSRIIKENMKTDVVMMVGDGINDVLAMKDADVSISLANSSADRVKLASDGIIFEDNLDRLPQLFDLSRESYRYMKQNLAFAQFYNLAYSVLALITFLDPFSAKSINTMNSLIVLMLNLRIERIKPVKSKADH
jgi:cation-transporting P-type ATPase C